MTRDRNDKDRTQKPAESARTGDQPGFDELFLALNFGDEWTHLENLFIQRQRQSSSNDLTGSDDETNVSSLEKQVPIEFKVSDYERAMYKLKVYFDAEVQRQHQQAYLGWTTLSRDGKKGDPVIDEFIALWKVLERASDGSQTGNDVRNMAAFLLLNEETRLKGSTGRFLVKAGKEGKSQIADLEKGPLERVMTQVFCPDIKEIGGDHIRLYRPVLTTPTVEQIETLREGMQARIEAGKQHCDEQLKTIDDIQTRRRGAAARKAEEKEKAELAKRRKFEKESGLDSIKALHSKRTDPAREGNTETEISRGKKAGGKIEAEIKKLKKAISWAQNSLANPAELSGRAMAEIEYKQAEAERRLSALQSRPHLEYQVRHPEEAVSILRERLKAHWKRQTKQATLKYAEDLEHDLKMSDNEGFYDERVALWQAVTELLVKDKRTAEEESAIDLGLFNLSNNLGIRLEYDSIKFAENFNVHILEGIEDDDPDIVAKYSELDLSYPDAARWEEIVDNKNEVLSEYAAKRARQEEKIANIKWANSPEGRAVIDARRRKEAADHARWTQRHEEMEREAEARRAPPECRMD